MLNGKCNFPREPSYLGGPSIRSTRVTTSYDWMRGFMLYLHSVSIYGGLPYRNYKNRKSRQTIKFEKPVTIGNVDLKVFRSTVS